MKLINLNWIATVIFMSFPASAQSPSMMPGSANSRTATTIDRAQPLRVMVTFRAPIDASSDSSETENAMAEKARRTIYAQAAKECSMIVESFEVVECRLENLQIMIQAQSNGMRQVGYVNANANYVVRPK